MAVFPWYLLILMLIVDGGWFIGSPAPIRLINNGEARSVVGGLFARVSTPGREKGGPPEPAKPGNFKQTVSIVIGGGGRNVHVAYHISNSL